MTRNITKRMAGTLVSILMSASLTQAADQVSVAMDWIVNGTHSGYFVAKEKGYYTQAGLDVTISRGFGSGDTVKRVATGSTMFGVADTSAVIASRSREDVPVRIISMVYGKAPLGIIYLKSSNITKPQDIMGKKIARTASGSSVVMFPAFLQANNIDRSKIEEIVGDANTMLPLLMSKRVDAVLGQTVNVARYKETAKKQNAVVETMTYSDFGLDAYGNSMIAGVETLKQKPDVAARFVEASLKGFSYAMEHPEEAVAIIKKAHPETDAAALLEEIEAVTPIITTEETKKNGLGYISESRMQKTIDVVTKALGLKRELKVSDVYDPQFQPKKPVMAKN